MHLGRAKNLLILMLLLANAAMAGLLGWRVWSDAQALAKANNQLVGLLAKSGIHTERLPDAQLRVPALLASRSHDAEAQAVFGILGDITLEDRGGGIMDYHSDSGGAQFRSDGWFEVWLDPPADSGGGSELSDESYEALGFQVLRGMGFSGLSSDSRVSAVNGGRLVVFGQTVQEHPVFNARAEVLYNGTGQLEQISGWWCFGTPQPENGVLCKSAGAVLLQYASSMEEQSLEVLDIQLGYRLRPFSPDTARLSPEWRIICSDRELYLDAFTASLSTE